MIWNKIRASIQQGEGKDKLFSSLKFPSFHLRSQSSKRIEFKQDSSIWSQLWSQCSAPWKHKGGNDQPCPKIRWHIKKHRPVLHLVQKLWVLPCAGRLSFPVTSIISWKARNIRRTPTQQWEISHIPYKTGSASPSNLLVCCSLLSKSHKSPREGASPSFHEVSLISALNKANQCSVPQWCLLSSGFPQREETQCPEERGRHIPHSSGSCKSCLSAWSGCNFGVIYSNYSFNLNHNWMFHVAQPVLLRREHPHWVRLVYKSSELNIFIRFLPCLFLLSSNTGNLLCSSSFPKPGEEPAFCQYMEQPACSFSPQNSLVSKHQPDSERGSGTSL